MPTGIVMVSLKYSYATESVFSTTKCEGIISEPRLTHIITAFDPQSMCLCYSHVKVIVIQQPDINSDIKLLKKYFIYL